MTVRERPGSGGIAAGGPHGLGRPADPRCRGAGGWRFGRPGDVRLEIEDGPARLPTPHLDKIVEELVDNACKFSPPGAEVLVGAGRQGGDLTIAVTDRGWGMTPEQIQSVGALRSSTGAFSSSRAWASF